MTAPVLAVGDGALGFWKAIRDVFPDTKEQRCWWHKIGNVLAALPKSAHPAAKKALAEIYNAENKAAAVKAAHTPSRPSTGRSGPRRWPRWSTSSTC
jgi:putative transposase